MAQQGRKGKLVVVIDDDPAVLEGMSGLLRGWGCRVIAVATEDAALARLAELGRQPDFIICDYRLADGKTGIQAIERLREAFEIPALLITGETAPPRPQQGRASHHHLLHKPVDPTSLQALLTQVLARENGREC